MGIVIGKMKHLKTYQPFILDLLAYRNELLELGKTWNFKAVLSTKGLIKIGKTLKQFYLIYSNERIDDIFQYSFQFNGYWDTIVGLHTNNFVNNAKFKKKNPIFRNTFYPPLMDKNPIKNTIQHYTTHTHTHSRSGGRAVGRTSEAAAPASPPHRTRPCRRDCRCLCPTLCCIVLYSVV